MRGFLLFICSLAFSVIYSQDWKMNRFETEASVQLYVSKPGPDRAAENDPGLMLSQSYSFSERMSAGLGTGILSPYYTTNLLPIYVQAKANLITDSKLFIRGRLGKFIPFSPDNFEGGLFTELEAGHDISLSGTSKLRLAAGYSRQEMSTKKINTWWGDQKVKYEYNRIKLSLGWVF